MKKFLIIILTLSFCLTGCGDNNINSENSQEQNSNNYSASKISTTDNTSINNTNNIDVETNIASFSTKIYTPNDKARMNNIQITCSKLNGTIVKARRNFFFL